MCVLPYKYYRKRLELLKLMNSWETLVCRPNVHPERADEPHL